MTSILDAGGTDAPPATLASRGSRLLASAIDVALYAVGSRPLLRVVFPPAIVPIVAGIWVLALAIIQIVLLCMRGQTVGKRVTRIAIVDQFSNDLVGYLRVAVVRQGPQTILSMFLPTVGLAYLIFDGLFIFSKRRRCLHDRLAGTVVIQVSADWPHDERTSVEHEKADG
jgi:uncharacterized RDD family membrane protein YckC